MMTGTIRANWGSGVTGYYNSVRRRFYARYTVDSERRMPVEDTGAGWMKRNELRRDQYDGCNQRVDIEASRW